MALKDIIDRGDMNALGAALKAGQVGTLLAGENGVRTVRESGVAVASAAATPKYAVLQLLYAKTVSTGAAGVKAAKINGASPSAGEAAPNAGGTSVAFHAETTGTGTCELVYLTTDPPKDADGVAATALTSSATGLY